MKKKLFFAAVAIVALASCSDNEFIGDNSPTTQQENAADEIQFGFDMQKVTRADIYGGEAAKLLGNNFYVTGTKGTEPTNSPTTSLVFDNYLVHFGINTAGTTESNTANWEYVGIDQETPTYEGYKKLSSTTGAQTIKFWDYSVPQYDFLAFSTGTYKAGTTGNESTKTIGVTAMKYGADLAGGTVAYTFDVPSVLALKNAFISDINEVPKTSYGKEVTMKFKNLGSKVRIALYETIPGYSVRDVKFYQVDGTNTDLASATKYDDSYLIGANNNSFPTNAKIKVYFPHVGSGNDTEADYDKAAATVEPADGTYDKFKTFGALTNQLVAAERAEKKWDATNEEYVAEDGDVFLGRTLPEATFAGNENAAFYETVFPVSTAYPLTLRVDYTLVPIDGATEVINVYGAKAVVPSTYTKWLPNYAYTYIFKISDNTNGWTSKVVDDPSGLFPITFDAVVAEATDATGEQTTITTVATPSITTYQQGHDHANKDEYSKTQTSGKPATVKNLYVQVMDNKTTSATLVDDLDEQTSESTDRSLLYLINRAATEAEVMDALQNRTTAINAGNVTGRNSITLTKQESGSGKTIYNKATSIVNGVDDNPITVAEGTAAEIAIGSLTAGQYYAYVYDYSDGDKVLTTIYQPKTVSSGSVIATTAKYIKTGTLDGISATTAANEAVNKEYIYFSKTTDGTGVTTYSFVSVDGKEKLPAGLLKVGVSNLTDGDGTVTADANTFVFDTYIRNDGKYAVKVIKIVA